MSETTDNEVIEVDFRPNADIDNAALRIKSRQALSCEHTQSIVDEKLRTVECGTCGAELDAVETLLGIAKRWDRIADWVKHLRGEKARLAAEVEELKRVRSSLKSQVRRKKERARDEYP
jgi:hypothetical protein